MKIVYLVSRQWSADILKKIADDKNIIIKKKIVFTTKKIFLKNVNLKKNEIIKINEKNLSLYFSKIKIFKPNLIFAFGWSGFLSKKIRKIAPCLVLHPSKLPLFRGGSPIQNQLINGIQKSAVTILFASDKIDSGDILYQKKINFNGYLEDIQGEIVKEGIKGAKFILDQNNKRKLISFKQNHKIATTFKRRKPSMSKISIEDFEKHEAEYFYNLVRGLQKPYPECYIKCKNNTKLYLQKVKFKR